MKKRELSILLVVALFSVVLISWPEEVSDYITGAQIVSKGEDKKFEKESDIFVPSEELLAEREAEYAEISLSRSGGSSEYDRVLERGIKVSYSPREDKVIKVYNPKRELVKEIKADKEIDTIKLEEDNLIIGVFEIKEETIQGEELSKDYFLVESSEKEISKEKIEKIYDIKEEDLLESYGIDKEVSAVLLSKLAKANTIEKTSKEDVARFREVLKLNRHQKKVLDIASKLDKEKDVFFAPVNKEVRKKVVRKIDYDPSEAMLSPQDSLLRFGIYLSNEKDEIINEEEFDVLDIFVRNNVPGINLKF